MPVLEAHAVNAADWKAGRIADDAIFTDKNSMNVGEIQAFLNSKVPICDTWGTKTSEFGGGTRAQYAASVGNPAPFTCLKDYYEVPKTSPSPGIPANNYGGQTIPPGAQSAAQMIANAAQKHNISPKVLLIKLATESAGPLTSDDWPFLRQYTYAMGAHCPDSGPNGSANCDSNYAGFSIQIDEAASLLRWYIDSMTQGWWSYKKPYQVNSIQWTVASACGAGNVYIENKATAALYTYTPYQPNQAALNNLYGTGDSCSSYGNRNFWRVYNDWFGPAISTSPFISYNNRVYMIGAGNTYYEVPSQAILEAYGIFTRFGGLINYVDPSYTSGMTNKGPLPWIVRFDANEIYVASKQGLHQFIAEQDFTNYGYQFGQEAVLPAYLKSSYVISTQMYPLATQTDWAKIHYISSGKKQEIANMTTFKTMGTPIYSSRPNVTLPPEYLATLPNAAPIIANGQFVKNSDTNQVSIYTSGALQPINSVIANDWSAPIDYTAPSQLLNLLTQNPTSITSRFVTSTSDNAQYLLDNGRRFPLTGPQKALYGVGSQTYQSVSQDLINRFVSTSLTELVRQSTSPAVYVVKNSKLYHIYSEADLNGLGYNQSNVTVLKAPLANLFSDSNNKMYANARLIRVVNTPEVYIVDSNFTKHHIASEELFNHYGYSFHSVSVVNTGGLDGYTDANPLSQLIQAPDNTYWITDSACRWQVPQSAFSAYGFTTSTFQSVSSQIVASVRQCGSITSLVRARNQAQVYYVSDGQRHWVPSEQVFYQKGFSWPQVRVFSADIVQSIPLGSNVQ